MRSPRQQQRAGALPHPAHHQRRADAQRESRQAGGHVTIDVSNEMNRKQLTVMGSWTFSKNGQADCARFVVSRRIDVDSLFTHAWPLEEAVAAYQLFDKQSMGKGVLVPA